MPTDTRNRKIADQIQREGAGRRQPVGLRPEPQRPPDRGSPAERRRGQAGVPDAGIQGIDRNRGILRAPPYLLAGTGKPWI